MPTGWQPLPRSKSRPKGSLLVGPSAPASHKGAILGQYPPDSSQSYSIEKNIAENDSVYVLTQIDLGHDARRSFHRSPTPFFASHSIVSYAGPLQRRLELLQYGIHDIIRHMRREIQFQPRSRRLGRWLQIAWRQKPSLRQTGEAQRDLSERSWARP
jgi:hypothetical protein